ncbi:MAG TPA: hypothetical protein VL527_04940 [Dongiaceae bacterium]|jgi:hypothetical protein|nr:hypothetical protein [Dongiaceae bacterium]
MSSTTTEKNRLEALSKRLRFIGKVNIGLMLVLFVCSLLAFFVTSRFSASPDQDVGLHHVLGSLLKVMIPLALVCLGLLLIFGPALVVCYFKLNKMRGGADA